LVNYIYWTAIVDENKMFPGLFFENLVKLFIINITILRNDDNL
jgi:hypothetical protein